MSFSLALAYCNTVIPLVLETSDRNERSKGYRGESPDEQTLDHAAASYSFVLVERTSIGPHYCLCPWGETEFHMRGNFCDK